MFIVQTPVNHLLTPQRQQAQRRSGAAMFGCLSANTRMNHVLTDWRSGKRTEENSDIAGVTRWCRTARQNHLPG
jgi:hypothetical protein